MPSPLRRRIRHTRRLFGYGALVLLILAAVMVGLLNQLLPLVEQHPRKVAGWLSERVGQPVMFSRARGEWTRRGPRFTLDGLRIGEGARSLDIGRAELLVSVYSGLLPGEPLTELKIRELALVLEQGEDGRWRMAGLPFEPRPGTDPFDTLEALGELRVDRARLAVRSPAFRHDLQLPRVDLRLRVDGDQLRAGLAIWAQAGGRPLSAAVDLQRGTWSGELWAGGEALKLDEWSALLADTGLVVAGAGNVDLWARIDKQRVLDVRTRAALAPLALGSRQPWLPDADGELHSPPAVFERADVLARWQADENGWQLHAPLLHFHETGRALPRSFDGLWVAGGERFALQAPQMDLAPARALAQLSPSLPEGLRRWLHDASPDGGLRDVYVHGHRDQWRGTAKFDGVGWGTSQQRPGVQGLSGVAAFDQRGGVMRLAPDRVRFDWDRFRQPLELQLAGTLAWWRDAEQWTLGASGLRVRGEDFGMLLRGELRFQGEGRSPRIELAAEVDPTQVTTAGKFWVLGKMPETTMDWLDKALQAGSVEQGRVVLSGELSDWPFRNGEGRFDARARIAQAQVEFNPGWPVAEALDLDVTFDGPGMTLDGDGEILGNRVRRVVGGIADFREPRLRLDIDAPARGEPLQALMLASPLREKYDEHLRSARISGPAVVFLELDLPLSKRLSGRRIEGHVDLAQARLQDPRWDIDFTEVSGRTRFSDAGFEAAGLQVTFEEAPGEFTLQVGEAYTGDAALAARASLSGQFAPQVLLARHPPLAWLDPWLSGRSNWTLRLDVPRATAGTAAPASRLSIDSDLVGTTISLPAPLAKPAGEALALSLRAPLPVRQGEVELALADLMRLRARIGDDDTLTGLLQMGAGDDLPLPAQGLAVAGTASDLDVAGWIGFAAQGEGAGNLGPVDLQVRSLDLLGSVFADTRLQLRRESGQVRVQVAGAGVAGSVEIPSDISEGVRGNFERLHWPERAPPSAEELAAAEAGTSQDPSTLPPLHFTVQDLRSGSLALGQAELVTVPMASGLRIERFTARSPGLELLASGDWLRTSEGHSQSRFDVEFEASSLGELMSAFGLAGMIEDGRTRGLLKGEWPGSPGAFTLSRFTGRLSAEVGEGQLLEVEPGGGGRVLGLISLAEIPRRLSLDFSDFFDKGFGFNTMSGEFVFDGGTARTDLLLINGPAAEIRVSGSTDLRLQQYEQRIEVLPKTGGALPVIGAIAGGPVGAAVGAVAQAVLQQPLKQAARTVYRVSGPWAEPKVEVIEKGPPPLPQRPAPGA
jgi:uncharacterized protein (TIGR02099 family)